MPVMKREYCSPYTGRSDGVPKDGDEGRDGTNRPVSWLKRRETITRKTSMTEGQGAEQRKTTRFTMFLQPFYIAR